MIQSVKEGLDNYKAMLKEYFAKVKNLKKTYGENTPPDRYGSSSYEGLKRDNERIQAAVAVLGLSKEEEAGIDHEVMATL